MSFDEHSALRIFALGGDTTYLSDAPFSQKIHRLGTRWILLRTQTPSQQNWVHLRLRTSRPLAIPLALNDFNPNYTFGRGPLKWTEHGCLLRIDPARELVQLADRSAACPVRALHSWLAVDGHRRGRVFQSLSAHGIVRMMARRLQAAKLDGLRAGPARGRGSIVPRPASRTPPDICAADAYFLAHGAPNFHLATQVESGDCSSSASGRRGC